MLVKKIVLGCALLAVAAGFSAEIPMDNSALIPAIRPDAEVKLETVSPGTTATPD